MIQTRISAAFQCRVRFHTKISGILMFTKMNSAALAAALMLLAGTVNANAGVATYADFASWSAVVSGSTSLAIPAPNPGSDDWSVSQYFETGTVTYGGVTFSTSGNGFLFNIGPGFEVEPGVPAFNGGLPVLSSQLLLPEGFANILITLAAPVKAFALNFDTFLGSDVTFAINGETRTLASAGQAYDLGSFFGVTDDTPFKTILLTSLNPEDPVLSINALHMGAAVPPIPEPATWVMLIIGFVGMGLLGSRMASRRAQAC
jgi:hypothetical protein